jgi:hypothetical protein
MCLGAVVRLVLPRHLSIVIASCRIGFRLRSSNRGLPINGLSESYPLIQSLHEGIIIARQSIMAPDNDLVERRNLLEDLDWFRCFVLVFIVGDFNILVDGRVLGSGGGLGRRRKDAVC